MITPGACPILTYFGISFEFFMCCTVDMDSMAHETITYVTVSIFYNKVTQEIPELQDFSRLTN